MRTPIMRRVASVLLAFVLALVCLPALPAFAAGENVSVSVIGPNADNEPVFYVGTTSYELGEGEDAWTATQKALDEGVLTYDAENSTYGVLLNSITSPVDGTVLAFDEASGAYWQLFVDGVASEVGISGVEVADGMDIVWYYSAFGDTLPEHPGTLAGLDAAAPASTSSSFPVLPVVCAAAAAVVVLVLVMRSRKNA